MEIIEFIEAKLDEAESVARKATPGDWCLWGMSVLADQDGSHDADKAVGVAATFMAIDGKPRTHDADHIADWDPRRVLAACAFMREVIELHKQWPVLIQAAPSFEPALLNDAQQATVRMTQQIAWLTQQQFRRNFGKEPPTAPMIRAMAKVWREDPRFQEEWA